jgi:uncharacterized protein YndB with AHSA1/START domain
VTIRIVRTFKLTPAQVYSVWTDDRLMGRLLPDGCTLKQCLADPRVGGRWRLEFVTERGDVHAEGGEYLELVPGERIVQSYRWETTGSPEPDMESIVTVELREIEPGLTEMVFVQSGKITPEARGFMEDGWNESFDKIEAVFA